MRISVRRRGPVALPLVALVAMAAAACAQTTPAKTTAQALTDTRAVADPARPATWKLPLEAYLLTDQEDAQIRRAMNSLTEQCMRKAGYTSWSPAPDLPKLGPKTLTDWRYGIHDADLSSKRGYHPDAAEQAAYDAAMEKTAVDGTTGDTAKALSNCAQQSKQQVGGGDKTYGELAQSLANDAFLRSKQEPEVTTVFGQWSACMKESGYNYKQPLDASDDQRFGGRDVTQLEIDTALADLKCRDRTKVAWIWYQAETRLQKDSGEKNAQALRSARTDLDAAVKHAAAVLAGGQ